MLESYIRERLREKDILLMTHIVVGYPSMEVSFRVVETMVEAGVDLIELQIPFSEPVADGPVILGANQEALRQGIRVQECFDFAGDAARRFDIPFLVMTYYNILFKGGVRESASLMAKKGIRGAIVPDLPHEEGVEYLEAMGKAGLSPILLFAPTTPPARMREIASRGKGFVYCVARRGVTGAETRFSDELIRYLERCRKATDLPLAVGFGIRGKGDIDFLKGRADIAVIGTRLLQCLERDGLSGVKAFLWDLL
ncbi:MAG: tryptophan synthase subunit alpha [Deltaproteobacteria bacterium]|nr:tryptophan synthase subunit alpha [Deltaproteobacteria bacterium]MBW2018064.1 tryptophan synthase subunit alpha [Deltaproteobacteria bacterium]MBW2130692.1 tryptophan synthase subunit alpha [Deltaproteobacteria bacterium]MBW2304869.1 tryptophan synthase subunit alpha [Deltaproteobacteria bacterium]